MKRCYLLIFLFFTEPIFSQNLRTIVVRKVLSDSIYYNMFPENYQMYLVDIKPSKAEKHYELHYPLGFGKLDQPKEIAEYNRSAMEQPVMPNDTMAWWAWDIHNKGLGGPHSIFFGKVRLNQKNNTLTLEQLILTPQRKRRKLRTQYKVLKWTFYEIILKDITHLSENLTYVFRH